MNIHSHITDISFNLTFPSSKNILNSILNGRRLTSFSFLSFSTKSSNNSISHFFTSTSRNNTSIFLTYFFYFWICFMCYFITHTCTISIRGKWILRPAITSKFRYNIGTDTKHTHFKGSSTTISSTCGFTVICNGNNTISHKIHTVFALCIT